MDELLIRVRLCGIAIRVRRKTNNIIHTGDVKS